MVGGRSLIGLVACCCIAVAVAAPNQVVNCMSGVPCGNLCAPIGGQCINNACYDSFGYPTLCYAPMAPAFPSPSWWQPLFPPTFFNFRPFQPFPPMQPMQPMQFPDMNDCGGKGPCAAGFFCDISRVCREDTCENQFQFSCPKDKGTLQKVNCLHNTGFTRCYESTSGGFRCNKGPAGDSVACASNGYSSTKTTMTANFGGNVAPGGGVAAAGSASSSSGTNLGPGGSTASGTVATTDPAGETTSTTTTTTTGGDSGNSADANAGSTDPNAANANAGAATAAADNTGGQPGAQTTNPVAAAVTPAAAADNTTAAAAAVSSNSSVSTASLAVAGDAPRRSGKQRRQQALAVSRARANATAVTEVPANTGTRTFIRNGVDNQQVTVTPDGRTVTLTNVASDGSAVGIGQATGDERSVTTHVIPGGSSVTSTSFSGPDGGPAAAAAGASAGSSAGGPQPLYMPYGDGQASTANAAWMNPVGSTYTQYPPGLAAARPAAAAAAYGQQQQWPTSSAGKGSWPGSAWKWLVSVGLAAVTLLIC